MSKVVARLRFQKLTSAISGSDDQGEVTLHKDGTVRLHAGEGLRNRLLRTADRVDQAALLYGATAFMGIAALGTTLVLKRRRTVGFVTLALAGLTALGASGVRVAAKRAPLLFDTLFEKEDVQAHIAGDGALTVTLAGKPWRGITLRFEIGEFDPGQAARFITSLRR